MMIKEYLLNKKTIFSFLISIVILYIIFSNVDFNLLLKTIINIRIEYYLISFIIFYLSILIKSYRWKILLKNINTDISLKESFLIYYLSMFVNSIVPAKLGDIYRGYLLKKITNKSISLTVGTIFIERIFDLIAMLTILLITGYISFFTKIPNIIMDAIKIGFIITLFLIFFSIIFIKYWRILPYLGKKIENIFINFEKGLRVVNFKSIPLLTFLSFLGWTLEGLSLVFVIKSLNLRYSIVYSIFTGLSSSLLTAVPFTPSGLGVVEGAMNYILRIGGYGSLESLSIVVLYRLISYFSIVILGGVLFILLPKILKE